VNKVSIGGSSTKRIKEEPAKKLQSSENPGQASNKMKIGLKEWKQWKEMQEKKYIPTVQIKEEKTESEVENQDAANYNKFLTLEECMEEDNNKNALDRYRKTSLDDIETEHSIFKVNNSKEGYAEGDTKNENNLNNDEFKYNVDDLIERLDAYWTKKNGDRRYNGRCKVCDQVGKMVEIRTHIKNEHPDHLDN